MDAGRCCVEACQASDAPVIAPLPQTGNVPAIGVAAALLKIVKSV